MKKSTWHIKIKYKEKIGEQIVSHKFLLQSSPMTNLSPSFLLLVEQGLKQKHINVMSFGSVPFFLTNPSSQSYLFTRTQQVATP